jgi:caffeoyl-CoA O-methyltransferase
MPDFRSFLCTILLFLTAVTACAQRGDRDAGTLPLANSEAEKKILAVLEEVRQAGRLHLSVPISDGRMLRLLTGYSGLWFCLALESTGGKLITFEYDKGRAATARQHFAQAGVSSMVTVIEGDAHENVKQLKGPVDVVFIDADKEGYVDYLEKLLPLVRPGGLILAHNTQLREVRDGYLKRVQSDPSLETVIYNDGGGLGITVKKR